MMGWGQRVLLASDRPGVGAKAAAAVSVLLQVLYGCFSTEGGSVGAEGPSQGEKAFGQITGSLPRPSVSVWGRERAVRGGQAPQTGAVGPWLILRRAAGLERTLGEGRGRPLEEEPECWRVLAREDAGGRGSDREGQLGEARACLFSEEESAGDRAGEEGHETRPLAGQDEPAGQPLTGGLFLFSFSPGQRVLRAQL